MTAAFDQATLARLSPRDLKVLIWRQKWLNTARPEQIPPEDEDWNEMICLAGRGWGKTLTGMQWLAYEAVRDPLALPSFVIAPTLSDVRYTCFEGPTGIISLIPEEMVKDFNRTNLIITLDNGAIIRGFSAEEPERLRGPQCARGVLEELAAWGASDEETFNMFMMGLRLGPSPKFMVTTTPKPRDLVRKLAAPKSKRIVINGTTYDNKANLPQVFFDQLTQYEGTQLGRQELMGELIDAEEGGIISRSHIRLWPHDRPLPAFEYIGLSLDTAFTSAVLDKKTQTADPTACGVFGVFWHEERTGEPATTNIMLLDAWEDRLSLPALTARVKKEMLIAYGDDEDRPMLRPLVGPGRMAASGHKPDIILIEDKGSGISLRQNLAADGVFTYAYNPGRADKTTRLHLASDVFARGQFWIPESDNPKRRGKMRSWAEPLVQQICSYRGPGSIRFDDYCDVTSQFIIFAKHKGLVTPVKKRIDERDRERDLDNLPRTARRSYVNPYGV